MRIQVNLLCAGNKFL